MKRFRKNDQGSALVEALFVIIMILLVIGVLVVGWQVGWWLKAKSTDKQTDVTRRSIQYQQARVDEIRQDMKNYTAYMVDAADPSRALSAEANKVAAGLALSDACSKFGELHGSVPSDIGTFFNTHPCPVG